MKTFGFPKMRVLGDGAQMEIRADAFNLFNITNLNPGGISSSINNTNFGRDVAILGARTVSFQARFSF